MFDGAQLFGYMFFGAIGIILAVAVVGGAGVALLNGVGILTALYFGLRFFNRLERRDRRDAGYGKSNSRGRHCGRRGSRR